MRLEQKIMREICGNCLGIAFWFAVGLAFCLALCLCSCKGKEYVIERVEVPVVVTQEHTIESVKIDHVRDTLIQRDSVFHYVKGDTVLIEKWHYLQGTSNVVRVDTLIKTDSVQVPVEVVRETVQTVEVEKALSWWQRCFITLGKILTALLGGGIALGGCWLLWRIKR